MQVYKVLYNKVVEGNINTSEDVIVSNGRRISDGMIYFSNGYVCYSKSDVVKYVVLDEFTGIPSSELVNRYTDAFRDTKWSDKIECPI